MAALAAAAILSGAENANVGGTTIPGYGAKAQSRAGAFTVKASDATAIFHNPAGLARQTGSHLHLSTNFINFQQAFTREGSYEACTDDKCPPGGLPYTGQPYGRVENQGHGRASIGDYAMIPLLAASSDFGLETPFVFGAGIFAPSAGSAARDYRNGYIPGEDPNRPPPPQRYDVLYQEAVLLLPSIAVGYRVNDRLSLGARLSWGFGNVKAETMVWGLRNFDEWDGFDSHVAIEAKDNFIPAVGIGAIYKLREDIELGANYRSSTKLHAKGTAVATPGAGTLINGLSPLMPKTSAPYRCGAGGTAFASIACLQIAQPQVASVGARWISYDKVGRERADVEFDIQWENWSATSTTRALVDVTTPTLPNGLFPSESKHGFKDSFSFRLGGSYALVQSETSHVELRGGLAHDTETAPLSWTRLDQDGFPRTSAALGVGAAFSGYELDLGIGYVYEGVRVVDHNGCNPTADNLGCANTGFETPFDERTAPDPGQPINADEFKTESPFNAGRYEQSYTQVSVGLSKRF